MGEQDVVAQPIFTKIVPAEKHTVFTLDNSEAIQAKT
jgi:hypothetical protein